MTEHLKHLKELLANANVSAFLDMIRHSEGTATPEGFNTMFGGKLFDSFSDHPHIFFNYKNKAGEVIRTSAAGAYQITYTTWKVLKERLGLTDFSPGSQNLAALELINEAGTVTLIITGKVFEAIDKVRHIWASLPGAGCHQPEHSLAEVKTWYEDAHGQIAA
jgi:lysozyme